MRIETREIGSDRVFVIAEAGVNHNGNVDMALKLVDVAADSGADAVKFQTFQSELLASRTAPKAAYQVATTGALESQLEMLKGLELSPEAHHVLKKRCTERNIIFLSTPFDHESADFLDRLPVSAFKLGSGEVTNWPLLRHVAAKNKPVILSTGMSYMSEVQQAIGELRNAGCKDLALLHCVSSYPAVAAEVNLRAMSAMKQECGTPVGFSDHTLGLEVAVGAVALGASIIEKHITLDKSLPGPDHRASLNPAELVDFIRAIRCIEAALGNGVKEPVASEMETRMVARRSLAARVDIPAGATISLQMLGALRPASGIPPIFLDKVVNRSAGRSLKAGEVINWVDIV